MITETRHDRFERHARECLDMVTRSSDPEIRTFLRTMAAEWLKLAEETLQAE